MNKSKQLYIHLQYKFFSENEQYTSILMKNKIERVRGYFLYKVIKFKIIGKCEGHNDG